MVDKLENLRHSMAHLLAAAVKKLWPGTHNAIGPAIENGFYQDFDFGEVKISEADLTKIEEEMRKLVQTWKKFTFKEVTLNEAKKLFKDNPYKIELAEEFAQEGKKLTVNDPGNFLDLCKMGHVENPSKELKHFKLLKLAGAYWRGNEKNKMLIRIYGTAFETKEELDEYLKMLEESKKRDHRILGKELKLFTFSNLVGPGLPLYMPHGEIIKHELEVFVRNEKEKAGYTFVSIPHIGKTELYEKSGHLGKYDAMMPIMKDQEDNHFVLKAMNCPHHFEIYNSIAHSYRELPIRLAETTIVYRNEKSGELSGLTRVKAITQDDTHTFVRHNQIESEIKMILKLMEKIYSTFGLTEYNVQISIRDPKNPSKYFGDDKLWKKSEEILIREVKEWGRPYVIEEGEAAFYGPKIDVMVKDSLGRKWQLTTVQLDFNQPENFDMKYVGEDGKEHRPAVLHIAIYGSIERFLAILIEHFAGKFPVWLSPVQVVLMTIADRHLDYAKKLEKELKENNIRVEIDDRTESISKKVRDNQVQHIPYLITLGDREIESENLAIRTRENKIITLKKQDFINQILKEIKNKDVN